MHKMSLADELAETRAEIARLRVREARLRDLILSAPGPIAPGRWARVLVSITRTSVFDPGLLPMEIRDDPHFRRERITQSIRCLPVAAPVAAGRPGWPIRRQSGAPEVRG